MRGVVVTNAVGRARCVEALTEHQPAGLLKPQPLLELQGAHGGDGFEVVMEPRDAHPKLAGDAVNSKRLVKVFLEALNSLGDVGSIAAQSRNVAEPVTLFSHPEPVDDFPRDQRREEGSFARGVQKPDESHHSIQQACIQRAYVDGFHIGMDFAGAPSPASTMTEPTRVGSSSRRRAKIRPLLRRLEDVTHKGQLGCDKKVVRGVVQVALVTEKDLLAALGNHAKGRIGHTVKRLRGEEVR